jgi:hypothetical protein
MIVDLRVPNASTKPTAWPMPNLQDELHDLHGSEVGPSRTFSTYNVRASVHRYVRLVQISDSTTKNGVNQEVRFPKKKRSAIKQICQNLLENWQRKSDARSCHDCLLREHTAADLTIDKG